MAKRYTDTTIWKKQRWFRKLSPIHKLAWKYITDTCDHAGILKIDFSEFSDDLGIDEFDINEFINECNTDFDKKDGKKIQRERIKLIQENIVWITGFIKFQYENKDLEVNPAIPAIYSALTILNGYGTLNEGLSKGYLTLSQPYIKGMLRTKDKDKDIIEKGISENENVSTGITFDMFKVFKKHYPNYPHEKGKDLSACLQLAYKIGDIKGWEKNDVIYSKSTQVLKSWESIVLFTLTNKWFSGRSLKDLNEEWQRLVQAMNGQLILDKKVTENKTGSKIHV